LSLDCAQTSLTFNPLFQKLFRPHQRRDASPAWGFCSFTHALFVGSPGLCYLAIYQSFCWDQPDLFYVASVRQ
jgi:hypothetical protein